MITQSWWLSVWRPSWLCNNTRHHPFSWHSCQQEQLAPVYNVCGFHVLVFVMSLAVSYPEALFTRYNLLSNRFDNRLYRVYKHSTPVWQQLAVLCKQTSNQLSNLFSNRFDNQLNVCLHDTAGCQTGCQTRLYNRFDNCTTGLTTMLNKQPLFVQQVVKPGLTTLLNEQLFVQPVVKPGCTNIWQPAVYTIQPVVKPGLNVCIHDTTGCQTGLTTGCIV